jgi:hypothetical protein
VDKIENLFLSVGAMKAGTTWLHQHLRSHPGIFFSPEKEIHYFADPTGEHGPMRMAARISRYRQLVGNLQAERMSQRVRMNLVWYARKYFADEINKEWYLKLFEAKGAAMYCADFSNLYAQLDAAGWAHVHECAENVKVIFTMRHPLERLWSHAKFQNVFSGSSSDPTRWKQKDFEEFFRVSNALVHGDYGAIVSRLRANTAPENLKLIFFEDSHTHPQKTLNDIEEWLGIHVREYDPAKLSQQVNATQSLEMPKGLVRAAKDFHKSQVDKLLEFGLQVPASWQNV